MVRMRNQVRLIELSLMSDGWHDGYGKKPTQESCNIASQLLSMNEDIGDIFYLYPTDKGGVDLEFDYREWSYLISISPDASDIHVSGVKKDSRCELDYPAHPSDKYLKDFFDTIQICGEIKHELK